jgi:hypothetical protein
MNLRTRILLGYGYLVAVLVVTAAGAALAFHHLGQGIEGVMAENFESVRAAMGMLEALERQDSACLSALLDEQGAAAALEQEEKEFLRALEQAKANVTIQGERPVIEDVGRLFSGYKAARDSLLASRPATPLAAYELDTFPRFQAVKASVIRLIELNHQAMREADISTRQFAMRGSIVLGMVVALAFLSFGLLSRLLNRHFLVRLADMKSALGDIATGNLLRRFDPVLDDELGLLARRLNAALDAEARAEGSAGGLLSQQRQLLLGMLERWGEPVAVVAIDGMLIASTLSEERERAVVKIEGAIRDKGRAALRDATGVLRNTKLQITTEGGEILSVSPLLTGPQRVVGWIVTFPPSSRPAGRSLE